MLTRATPGRGPVTAATPTMAQSWARRLNFWNDQPAPSIFGTLISVRTSSGCRSVSRKPWKKSVAAMVRRSLRSDRGEGGAQGQAGRRQVRRRVAVGDRSADGAPVAHLGIADLPGDVGQQRHVTLQHLADLEVPVAGQGADDHPVAVLADVGQIGQPADVDQHRRRRQAQLHQRQQRVAAGQQLGVFAVSTSRPTASSTEVARW